MADTSDTSLYTRTFDFELDGYPNQSFRVVLDSVTYEVHFYWNERDESWFFGLGGVGTDPVIRTKLTCYTELLAPYRYMDEVPNGNLYLFPLRDIRERAGRFNIGPLSGVQMAYGSLKTDIEEEDIE